MTRVPSSAKVRPEEGPQGIAVQQALNRVSRLFGTDGVRGRPTTSSLPSSRCAWPRPPRKFYTPRVGFDRPVAVVGRDPRASSEFLEAAVCAGLAAHGVDAIRLGVVPTRRSPS